LGECAVRQRNQLVQLVAIFISVVPGLLSVAAIVYATRPTATSGSDNICLKWRAFLLEFSGQGPQPAPQCPARPASAARS
jgi:hypothetical protein